MTRKTTSLYARLGSVFKLLLFCSWLLSGLGAQAKNVGSSYAPVKAALKLSRVQEDPAPAAIRLNAGNTGGSAVTTAAGSFAADSYFAPAPGFTFANPVEIANTEDDALYQDERSAEADNGSFSYAIPVSNGQYKVVLHFAELYWTSVGQRAFDVSLQGKLVLDNYDIIAKAGSSLKAVTETFTVDVTTGSLDLFFSSLATSGGINRPSVAAIEVLPQPKGNALPVANAGADKTVTLPANSVVLSGAGTDADGTIASYAWTKQSGPSATLTNANTAELTASNLVIGTYVFRLTVTDNTGATSFDDVKVTVTGTLGAEPIRFNTGGTSVTTAAGSFLADNYFTPAPGHTYTNSADVAGTQDDVLYQNERSADTENGSFAYAFPVSNGQYKVVLHFAELYWSEVGKRVFDVNAEGALVLDNYDIVARSGAKMTAINETFLVNVADGKLNLVFSALAEEGGVNRPSVAAIELVPQKQGNSLPIANAGADKAITLPTSSITLSGSGSDADGTIAGYAWSQQSGPAATLTNAATAELTASNLTAGSYVFRLTVTDNAGASGYDDVIVTVNEAPAGPAVVSFTLVDAATGSELRTLTNGDIINLASLNTKSLNIRANTHPDPVGSVKFALSGAQVKNATESAAPYALFGDNAGKYHSWTPVLGDYSLTGTPYSAAGGGGTAGMPLTIAFQVVDQTANAAPVANAGADQAITLPTNSVTLSGSGSDTDGTIASYAWTKQSGPAATMANANTPEMTASDLVAGSYVFRLTVADDKGTTAFDDVLVTVTETPAGPAVVSFMLIDASTNAEIGTITSGQTINLAKIAGKKINIKANTNPEKVGSVKFALSGAQAKATTESVAPYALFGDKSGVFNAWTPALGNYSLSATPYSATGGGGTAGTSLAITFQVVDEPATAAARIDFSEKEQEAALVNSIAAYPNPFSESIQLKIAADQAALYRIRVYDQVGKLQLQDQLQVLSAGTKEHTLSFTSGAVSTPGVYLIVVENAKSGISKTIRVMKAR